jgi:twitching motility two-component system response regulator PilG
MRSPPSATEHIPPALNQHGWTLMGETLARRKRRQKTCIKAIATASRSGDFLCFNDPADTFRDRQRDRRFDGQLHQGNYTMRELPIQEREDPPCMDTAPKQTLVVVIDDSPTICKILETCLRRAGHQAASYPDPVQALQALFRGEIARPDVLFVDLVLPHMDGYEVIKLLRARAEFKAIPIIAISGRDSVVDRLKARLAGANDYVTKPFKTDHIVALVQKYSSLDRN